MWCPAKQTKVGEKTNVRYLSPRFDGSHAADIMNMLERIFRLHTHLTPSARSLPPYCPERNIDIFILPRQLPLLIAMAFAIVSEISNIETPVAPLTGKDGGSSSYFVLLRVNFKQSVLLPCLHTSSGSGWWGVFQ